MQSQQPGRITGDHDPYDFITNPKAAPKKPVFSGAAGPKKILLIIGGLTIAVLILSVLAAAFGSGSGSKETYTTMLQQQAEIIRIADIGIKSAKDAPAQNLAITTKQTMESQTVAITAVASSAGFKIDKKQIAAGKNAETDEKLKNAEQINKFDEEFIVILKASLTDYQKTLKTIYDSSESKSSKETLDQNYTYVQSLIGDTAQDAKSGTSESTPATN